MFGKSSTASFVSHHVRASAEIGAANDVPVLRGMPNELAGMTQGLRWPVQAGHWVRVRRGSRPSCRVKRASGLGAFACLSRARDRRPDCGCHSDTVKSRAACCCGTSALRPSSLSLGRQRALIRRCKRRAQNAALPLKIGRRAEALELREPRRVLFGVRSQPASASAACERSAHWRRE